ncbi:hypothetical protein ACFLSA_04660 [Bacteroidota bacterium]
MKDKLEKFVLDNREEFDFREPGQEVWNRIQSSIKDKPKTRSMNWYSISWKVAAAIILFVSAFALSEYLHINDIQLSNRDSKIKSESYRELIEAEAYYTSQVNNKLHEMNKLIGEYPDIEKEIKNDFSELDSLYEDLKSDLKDNIANDEIIEAMIQNYRLKLEILEKIYDELKEKEKQEENESTQYEI